MNDGDGLVSKNILIVPDMFFDPLETLLAHFNVSANLTHSGPLCGETVEPVLEGMGYLHVIQRGLVEVRHLNEPALHIVEPSLLFYSRPLAHRFLTDTQSGADFACATVAFNAGRTNPIVQALPPMLVVPLAQAPQMHATIDLLFSEAFGRQYGRQPIANRLFEILVIQLLRKIVEDEMMTQGMLAGVAHPQLSKAMAAVHDMPAHRWTLENLGAVAGMSRSRFASTFKSVLGTTVGDYLGQWRLTLAQDSLRRGVPLKEVAAQVGYGNGTALSRTFKAHLGMSPRAWLRSIKR